MCFYVIPENFCTKARIAVDAVVPVFNGLFMGECTLECLGYIPKIFIIFQG